MAKGRRFQRYSKKARKDLDKWWSVNSDLYSSKPKKVTPKKAKQPK